MQNIPSELIITVKNYINITSFKTKGSPDLGQADICENCSMLNSVEQIVLFHLSVFVTFIHYILHNLTLYIDKLCSSDVLFRYLVLIVLIVLYSP